MADKITRATNLVAGLLYKGARLAKKIEEYKEEATSVVGDVLLVAAFVSYAGPFTRPLLERLVNNLCRPFLGERKVKIIKNPLDVICNEAKIVG